MANPEIITDGVNTFEVVDYVPLGYQIWNIGKNMVDGYLPLCRAIPGTYAVEPDTLKAIKVEGAEKVLAAIGGGQNTVKAMERYIARYKNAQPGSWPHRQIQRMQEALPIMKQLGL